MDLPESIRPIHSRLKEKYDLAFEDLSIRGKAVKLLTVGNIGPLLEGRDLFKDVADFPFWIKLWESAIVLADLMATLPHRPRAGLLELGAGLGAPGLIAAASGFRVTISDYQKEILDFPRVSAAVSGLADVDFAVVDWLNPPELAPYEVIIGAEVLFRADFFAPLLSLFQKMLAPGGSVYLAHDMRRQSVPKFMIEAEKLFDIAVSTRHLKTGGEEHTVCIHRLQRR